MKPFLKWAGGKTKLLPEILPLVPDFKGRYYEPFLGGGAVFAALVRENLLKSHGVTLNDANHELMNVYQIVSRVPHGLIQELQGIRHSKKTYYSWREDEPTSTLLRAVRFVYLNKTCFNGLYRVNRNGRFNVPIGSYKKPIICDIDEIFRWSNALSLATLKCEDFAMTIDGAKRGDFIYCDPPYMPQSETAEFTSYTKEAFGLRDHERLADSLARADKRGAKFILSQGDVEPIRKLFKGFRMHFVESNIAVGAAAHTRKKSRELLIMNYQ